MIEALVNLMFAATICLIGLQLFGIKNSCKDFWRISGMPRAVVKQPNGLYAVFSTIVDGFTAFGCSENEIIGYLTMNKGSSTVRAQEMLADARDDHHLDLYADRTSARVPRVPGNPDSRWVEALRKCKAENRLEALEFNGTPEQHYLMPLSFWQMHKGERFRILSATIDDIVTVQDWIETPIGNNVFSLDAVVTDKGTFNEKDYLYYPVKES
jgi:hypothetical protein